jgi:hypothetical protein
MPAGLLAPSTYCGRERRSGDVLRRFRYRFPAHRAAEHRGWAVFRAACLRGPAEVVPVPDDYRPGDTPPDPAQWLALPGEVREGVVEADPVAPCVEVASLESDSPPPSCSRRWPPRHPG